MAEAHIEYVILGCVVTKEIANKFKERCAEWHMTTDKALGLFVGEFIKGHADVETKEAQNDKDEGE